MLKLPIEFVGLPPATSILRNLVHEHIHIFRMEALADHCKLWVLIYFKWTEFQSIFLLGNSYWSYTYWSWRRINIGRELKIGKVKSFTERDYHILNSALFNLLFLYAENIWIRKYNYFIARWAPFVLVIYIFLFIFKDIPQNDLYNLLFLSVV